MNRTNWKPVQLPINLVNRIEKETQKSDSLYRNVSDYISSVVRRELENLEASKK